MSNVRLSVPRKPEALLIVPDRASLGALAAQNRAAAERWDFTVGDLSVQEMRQLCRCDVIARAAAHTARLGICARPLRDPGEPIVMTGHQPGLHHPGVWMKAFLLQDIADEIGASAVDLVVDTDAFDAVRASWPHMRGEPRIEEAILAQANGASCYATARVPSLERVAQFCADVESGIAPLDSPPMASSFAHFRRGLESALDDAANLAELLTVARRNHEACAGSDYAEIALSTVCRGEGFMRFVSAVICDATRFARCYNEALDAFRVRHQTRSKAQPTPDLAVTDTVAELPLWLISSTQRRALTVDVCADRLSLRAGEQLLLESAPEPRSLAAALADGGHLIAPKALALTLFTRMFCCDAFIHGVGGARYDEVTDDLCAAYYGVKPPAHITASMTCRLPLEVPAYDPAAESRIREELSRLEHNPDAVIRSSEAVLPEHRSRAVELVAQKEALVRAIGAEGADKKKLGAAIRETNMELARLLEPVRLHLQAELAAAGEARIAAEVAGGREYPLCFFDPGAIARRVLRT